jgi:putative membrane protein
MSNISRYLMVVLKGMGMGAADVIPGVSGGTIAFLTGIYSELISSIKSVDLSALKLLLSGKLGQFWKKINGNFLFSVIIGICISFLSLAKLMTYLMVHHPIPLWSFFFGLIISSAVYILIEIKKWSFSYIISLIVGIAIGAVICLLSPTETPTNLWFIFLCGAIAICAMILPGISGSFILLLLGKYHFMLEAITEFKLKYIIVFILGAAIGIISFSHFLSWLLNKYYNSTICLLAGIMIGSLLKVWPWQTVIEDSISRPAIPQENILIAITFMAIGIFIVLLLELLAKKIKK